MPIPPSDIVSACRGWASSPPRVLRRLSGSGFSGSPVWLVEMEEHGDERFVLKAFAGDRPPGRARAVHRLMRGAHDAGIAEVPTLLEVRSPDGGTIFADASGRLWEMAGWRPGIPVPAPSRSQASAAAMLLARVHHATADIPFSDEGAALSPGPPPAWSRRKTALESIAVRGWAGSDRPADGDPSGALCAAVSRFRALAEALLEARGGPRLLARLARMTVPEVPLQPVLRDVWQAHLLFEGDRVTGLIDFHAAGIDSPAADLARLTGSWQVPPGADPAAGPTVVWHEAMSAYESIRPLSPAERRLVDLLHAAGTIGSLDHWFRWVLAEERDFESPDAVIGRVDVLLKNLDSSLEQAESLLGGRD